MKRARLSFTEQELFEMAYAIAIRAEDGAYFDDKELGLMIDGLLMKLRTAREKLREATLSQTGGE